MDKDSVALLKFAIAIIIIAVLLIIWFNTVGAPGDDEEEALESIILDAIPAKIAGFPPIF